MKRMNEDVVVFWFRRDLRLNDNAGLYHALRSGKRVLPVFIFDKAILNNLDDKHDRRVSFMHKAVQQLHKQLEELGSSLLTSYGYPAEVFEVVMNAYNIVGVYTNHDYEPYAKERDNRVKQVLDAHGAFMHTYKDHVIFEKDEVLKPNGEPYTVFTPFSKTWRSKLEKTNTSSYPTEKYYQAFANMPAQPLLSLAEICFNDNTLNFPLQKLEDDIIRSYDATRDFPAIENGTSRMGVHLRFGTISIRQLVSRALELNATFLNELIWREFYQSILWHFPHVVHHCFKPAYEHIGWRNDEQEFERWCEGTTGYPIVDAGMRQLNATGFMHNRIRMVTASFLTKHLLIDWRWGEAYFAQKLLDYELASNNGGWQWAAGCGCDAAPYFRIFNPYLQTKKFDKDLAYVHRWVPEFEDFSYPAPIVEHEFARKRALEVYGKALRQ